MPRQSEVCIVGCGFVGFSLLECFQRAYKVMGFDISEKRIAYLKENHPMKNVTYTNDINDILYCRLYIVSVPTPLKEGNAEADMSIVERALEMMYKIVKDTDTVVLESSVAIGSADRLLKPFYEKGIKCGFSPERVDPGRKSPKDWEIPKIISGYDEKCLEEVKKWYSRVYNQVVPVSSMKTAEMCKLHENCQRMVNIAYTNEVSDACVKLGIDPMEMINACSTKPFGYMRYTPGLAVGGTCIPVNPYFLKMTCNQSTGCDLPILYESTKKMEERPIEKATELISKYHPEKVLVVGLGFKPGESFTVHSGALPFTQTLKDNGVVCHYYDPLVDSDICDKMPTENWCQHKLTKEYDAIAICTKQTGIDFSVLDKVDKSVVVSYPEGRY